MGQAPRNELQAPGLLRKLTFPHRGIPAVNRRWATSVFFRQLRSCNKVASKWGKCRFPICLQFQTWPHSIFICSFWLATGDSWNTLGPSINKLLDTGSSACGELHYPGNALVRPRWLWIFQMISNINGKTVPFFRLDLKSSFCLWYRDIRYEFPDCILVTVIFFSAAQISSQRETCIECRTV